MYTYNQKGTIQMPCIHNKERRLREFNTQQDILKERGSNLLYVNFIFVLLSKGWKRIKKMTN